MILRWLEEIQGEWQITLILGLGYSREKERDIVKFAARSPKRIEIIKDTNVISKHMNNADFAITAAGRTLFELTALAVPMIVIASNRKEFSHSILQKSFGMISLGTWKDVNKQQFQNTILDLINSKLLRAKMRNALLKQNVRYGIENVLEIINNISRAQHRLI